MGATGEIEYECTDWVKPPLVRALKKTKLAKVIRIMNSRVKLFFLNSELKRKYAVRKSQGRVRCCEEDTAR